MFCHIYIPETCTMNFTFYNIVWWIVEKDSVYIYMRISFLFFLVIIFTWYMSFILHVSFSSMSSQAKPYRAKHHIISFFILMEGWILRTTFLFELLSVMDRVAFYFIGGFQLVRNVTPFRWRLTYKRALQLDGKFCIK